MSRVFFNLFCYPGVDPELPYRPLHESKMLASDIMLSYHYHLHAGGEHYNSIVPASAKSSPLDKGTSLIRNAPPPLEAP